MSRPIRFQSAGLTYHVMARGNNKMPIFLDDLDHVRFLEILAEVVSTIRDRLVALLLDAEPLPSRLPNAPAKPVAGDGISQRQLRQWWNKRHRRVGHIFQGRFKAQIVEASVYLVRLCRYVLLNPVRAGLCSHPSEWPWSSYQHAGRRRHRPIASTWSRCCVRWTARIPKGFARGCSTTWSRTPIRTWQPSSAAIGASSARTHSRRSSGRVARAASKEVPARDRRVGTPALVEILADAVRRGEGLPGGVLRAHEAQLFRCRKSRRVRAWPVTPSGGS